MHDHPEPLESSLASWEEVAAYRGRLRAASPAELAWEKSFLGAFVPICLLPASQFVSTLALEVAHDRGKAARILERDRGVFTKGPEDGPPVGERGRAAGSPANA